MFDPFQTRRGPVQSQQGSARTQQAPARTQAAPPRGLLTDASPDAALLRPRSGKLLNAVKMLDKLTSGDEELHAYLSAKAAEEKPRPAFDPFAGGWGATPSAEDDPLLEVLTEIPPPPVDTQEFQKLKEELMEQCQEIIQEETAAKEEEESVTLLAPCGLFRHRIHTVNERGEILRHYRPEELNTALLRKADQLLHQGYVLVEVRGDFPDAAPGSVIYAVGESGAVRKVIL